MKQDEQQQAARRRLKEISAGTQQNASFPSGRAPDKSAGPLGGIRLDSNRRANRCLLATILLFTSWTFVASAAETDGRPSLTYLVIDKSGSIETGGLIDPILGAVTEFVGGLGTNAELRVVYFNDRATKEQSWRAPLDTRAKGEFIRRMQRDFRPAGQTRLFDTVGEVLASVMAERANYGRVDIKILSDGLDNRSTKYSSWHALSPLTQNFKTGRENFITWITLGFDPKENQPSADSGIVTVLVPEPTKPFSIAQPSIEAKPIAAFEASPRILKVGSPAEFRLLYPKGVTVSRWSFGDGNTGEGLWVQHSYQQAGSYTIRADVEGPGGKDVLEMSGFVQVLETIPVRAAFSASPRNVKIGEEGLFALESSAGATNATWNFGDGVYATNFVTRHAYSKAGTYTVKVVVEGPAGTDLAEAAIEVVNELPVSATFSVSPRKAKVGEELLFTLDSPAGISLATWDFGDGSRASNSLVRHTYSKVGDYDVTVEVFGPGGQDASTRKSCVHIKGEAPLEAAFSWAPRTVIAGQEVELIDESSGGPTRWTWDIQGVGSRTGRAPTVTFVNAGGFLVTLTVENEGLRATISKTIQVVAPAPQLLQALFEVGPVTGTSPLRVQFKDQSKGAIANYAWDFGDGQSSDLQNPVHVYKVDAKLVFHPRLIVRDSKGREAKDPGAVVVSVVPAPPWWRWPAAGLATVTLIGVWIVARHKPTPVVGKVVWQEQGQTKRRELEGTVFDLATLPLKGIAPGKYVLRNIHRSGRPFLIQDGREPRPLEHNESFEVEGVRLTYLEY